MVSTRKKRQSNKRLLSQLDDFDRNMIIGDTVCERQESFVPNEDTNAQDFTGGTSNVSSIADENALNVKALERCFNERIDREMSNIVDTVEDRIENAILTAIDNIVAPKIELAIRSINASSGRDVTSMSASSERRERAGINASFENVSENNNTLDVPNKNDGARHNSQVEVSELSVPGTYFDGQPHTHRMVSGLSDETHHNGVQQMMKICVCVVHWMEVSLHWEDLQLVIVHQPSSTHHFCPRRESRRIFFSSELCVL